MDHKQLLLKERTTRSRPTYAANVVILSLILGILIGNGLTLILNGLLHSSQPSCEVQNPVLGRSRRNLEEVIDSPPLVLCRKKSNDLKEKLNICEASSKSSADEIIALNEKLKNHDQTADGFIDQIKDLERKLSAKDYVLTENREEIKDLKHKLFACEKSLSTNIVEIKELKKKLAADEKDLKTCTTELKEIKEKFTARGNLLTSKEQEMTQLKQRVIEAAAKVNDLEKRLFSSKQQPPPVDFDKKCTPGWSYLAHTDSCYYYHNFTLDDSNQIIKFSWDNAEKNCQQWGAHLLSLHSKIENQFIKEMIKTNLQTKYPNRASSNFCMDFRDHAWIGLKRVDGIKTYTDGSDPDDYIKSTGRDVQNSMCYEHNHGDVYGVYADRNFASKQPRFICKKPANS